MKHVTVIIPARLHSTRLPHKPLVEIGGKPLITRVVENVQELVKQGGRLIVAIDDNAIKRALSNLDVEVVLTPKEISSGTERVAWVVRRLNIDSEIIVNLQVDEPGFTFKHLRHLLTEMEEKGADISTPITPIKARHELFDHNVVKVVVGSNGYALYFSRQPIPYQWVDPVKWLETPNLYFRHVGVYMFKTHVLREITKLKPHPLENAERLEQLRWLVHGYRILCVNIEINMPSIDTMQDVHYVQSMLETEVPA